MNTIGNDQCGILRKITEVLAFQSVDFGNTPSAEIQLVWTYNDLLSTIESSRRYY